MTSLGAVMVMVINLITTPIISRVFTPDAYGTAGLYTQSIGYLALLVGLMLPAALVVVRRRKVLYHLISGLKVLWGIGFILILIGSVCFGDYLKVFLNDSSDGWWLVLLPIGLLLGQIADLTYSLNVRAADFTTNVKASLSSNLLNRIGSLLLGWWLMGHYIALIVPSMLSICAVLYHQKWFRIKQIWSIKPSFTHLRNTLDTLKNYPKYMLPANILSLGAISAPFFVFSVLYSPAVAGLFLFAENMLLIPFRLVNKAVTPVYLQDISGSFHDNPEEFREISRRINSVLFLFGLVPYSILTVFGPEIFAWVFGEDWTSAGEMAQYLAFFILFRLACSPLSAIYRVAKQEKIALQTQAVLFVLRIVPLAIGLYWFNLELSLLLFAIGSLLGYWFHYYQLCRVGELPFLRTLLLQSVLFAGSCGLFWLIKYYLF